MQTVMNIVGFIGVTATGLLILALTVVSLFR
jgi:hypothetical protein